MKTRFARGCAGLILAASSLLLTACPLPSHFPLVEQAAAVAIDGNLAGKWATTDDSAEGRLVRIVKKDSNAYHLSILKKSVSYFWRITEFEAWTARFENQNFLILASVDVRDVDTAIMSREDTSYFLYQVELKEKTVLLREISSLSMSLDRDPIPALDRVGSVAQFQDEIRKAIGTPSFLSRAIVYKRRE